MELKDSCCKNCGQQILCMSYEKEEYSDECRFYYPQGLSIDFIKSRTDLSLTDFSNCEELNTELWLHKMVKDKREFTFTEENAYDFITKVDFDPVGDWEYYTMASCVCDGTLVFLYDTIKECLTKVITGDTYDTRQHAPTPECILNYTIGSLVITTEIDNKFAPVDRPWLTCRYTVFLPVKYRYEEKGQNTTNA